MNEFIKVMKAFSDANRVKLLKMFQHHAEAALHGYHQPGAASPVRMDPWRPEDGIRRKTKRLPPRTQCGVLLLGGRP